MAARKRAHQHPATPTGVVSPLTGFTLAVISGRRRHAIADGIENAGGRTVSVQGVRVVPQLDQELVRRATIACLTAPIDELLVGSAFGFRAWLSAAEGWQLADQLVAEFASARLLAADARAADSLRLYGMREIWSTAAASTEELLRYLLLQPVEGQRIVVQLASPSQLEACHALRAAGAEVIEVPTFRAMQPNYVPTLRRPIELVIKRQIDAVILTSEQAAHHLLARAGIDGRQEPLLDGLRTDVPVFCLGTAAAGVLREHGVEPIVPELPFLLELMESLTDAVPRQAVHSIVDGHSFEVRGHAIVLDGQSYPVQQGPLDVLRALARAHGRVLSCAEIRRALPGLNDVDDHAIEMAVYRLRRELPEVDLVQTIIKRGYRLAV